MKLRVTRCAVCSRPKWREVNPKTRPGQVQRVRLRGWCACVE
jgi:hypothetical protein